MKTAEIRKRFLDFFEKNGHRIMRSDPLIPPAEDKSLLFTGAGMNKFKNEFTGRGEPDLKRAATSQKCLRTGDVDNVGRTAYHHTFFEMLGNFSFGDYFKREAIHWAWEFFVNEMKIPAHKLRVSVYKDDDEAYAIWEKEIGLDPKIIHRFGEHDNFWPADAPKLGPNGLCGPCSEIFYDWGEGVGCGKPDCNPSCDCHRFCEVWNLVFQQFDRKDGGVLDPLPTRNIDTGMGLERIAAVMQGKQSNFDIDIFVPILADIERETGSTYASVRNERGGVAFRRIADHVRAAVFCIADGILPGNTGRGYVLRKLIRRAVLDARYLGKRDIFLYRLVPTIAQVMGDQYPELIERRENIARLIKMEEERFGQTLGQGQGILEEMVAALRASGAKQLSGADAFRLFDTYGLPLDVTESILSDEGFTVDHGAFEKEMEQQRDLSRKGTKIVDDIFGGGPIAKLKEEGVSTVFEGYVNEETRGTVAGILCGETLVDELREGQEGAIVLDRTTFYGESGGEVGDTGLLDGDAAFEVTDARRSEGLVLHVGKVIRGTIRRGAVMTVQPDVARRAAVRRNHTATHLLHLALREVLGTHAEQAGSLVAPERLRFDFHHMKGMSTDEIRLVEDKVNQLVLRNMPVDWRVVSFHDAKAEGAMALFGEKYGDEVRLVNIGGESKELCGGLHCSATGDIGLFKIVAESSVAAGIRRIEAVTGMGSLELLRAREAVIASVCAALNAQEVRLVERAEQLSSQVKDLRKELDKARRSSGPGAGDYLKNARDLGGTKLVAAKVDEASADDLRALVDQLRQGEKSVAIVLGGVAEGRVSLTVAFTKDLVERKLHAGKIAGEAAKLVGGGGGGRPDMAQAGGKDPDGLDKALERASELIAEKLS